MSMGENIPGSGGDDAAQIGGNIGAIGMIPGIGGVIDTFVNAQTARRNTDKTIQAQKEQADLAYQRSIAMWNMQNLYNSPLEQMKRFGAAGLNPHLIYGQGSSGNANNAPEYQAPNLQYRYAAPAYGGAVASILPTLMAVGTWMQNMRLSEAELQQKQTSVEKTEQLIEFLREQNPRKLQELENRLSLYPYQKQAQQAGAAAAAVKVSDLLERFKYEWGDELKVPNVRYSYAPDGGGARGVQRRILAEKFRQAVYGTQVAEAKASWSDMNITDPQALIQLVLGGVLSMAGVGVRAGFRPKTTTVERFKAGRTGKIYQRTERR